MVYPLQGLPRGVRGQVRVLPQGLYCRIEAETDFMPGLWRVFLRGSRDILLLGVLQPEGERLCLSRSLSLRQLGELGELCGAFLQSRQPLQWEALSDAAAFFRSAYWKRAAAGCRDALTSGDEPRFLALPYNESDPFPLTELFCFARRQSIQGREYLVFAFDGKEFPIFL